MGKIVLKMASDKGFGMNRGNTYVGNCVGNKEKGSQNKSSETLFILGAPLTAQSCNQGIIVLKS